MATVIVNPDQRRHILSATRYDVILLGHVSPPDNEDDVPCVLYVLRETWFAAMKEWLDRKADYNGSWGGVGFIMFEHATLSGPGYRLPAHVVGIDPDGPAVGVKTYFATSAFAVDMEDG
jgi:hypothetical protein